MIAATALCACGDRAGSVTVDTARLALIEKLTPGQYTALKKLYVAARPLDTFDGSHARPRLAALKVASKPFVAACSELDSGDPLLGPSRAQCQQAATFLVASDPSACTHHLLAPGGRESENCQRAFTNYRAALDKVVASSRVADRAVRATHLPRACKRALVTTKQFYLQARNYDLAVRMLVRALGPDARADAHAALGPLARHRRDTGPTAQQQLDQLRRHCH
jgi:hypothetical protein